MRRMHRDKVTRPDPLEAIVLNIRFAAGEHTTTVAVKLVDDDEHEPDKEFYVPTAQSFCIRKILASYGNWFALMQSVYLDFPLYALPAQPSAMLHTS